MAWPLAPGLEPTSRDNNSKRLTIVLLDYSCCDMKVDGSPEEFARSVQLARSLATLLSHPGCVSEIRRRFLDRFEELAFYDGKAVFPKPQNRGGFKFGGMSEPETVAEKHPVAASTTAASLPQSVRRREMDSAELARF